MLLGWLGDGGPVACPILLDVPEQVIYMRRAFHNHTDMIEQLSTQRLVLSQLGRRGQDRAHEGPDVASLDGSARRNLLGRIVGGGLSPRQSSFSCIGPPRVRTFSAQAVSEFFAAVVRSAIVFFEPKEC